MPNRPYLTSAEAATYCGFKTIGGIQQAVRRGKLKPAGRRGGTGTYVFATEELDLFLTGGGPPKQSLDARSPDDRSVVATQNSPKSKSAPQPALKSAPASSRRKPATEADPVSRILRALASGGPAPESPPKASPKKTPKSKIPAAKRTKTPS